MGEALANFYTAINNAILNVIGFVQTLFAEHNYIALAAITATLILVAVAVGLMKRRHKRSR